jgi:RNA polymerase sigma factor (sigma-70 family)
MRGQAGLSIREPVDTEAHDEPFLEDTPYATRNLEDAGEGSCSSDSMSDVGFFLSLAARYPLLSAQREKELGTNLWKARRRLARAVELAKRANGSKNLRVLTRNGHPTQPISPTTRRRLMAVEEYSERLRQLVDGGEQTAESLDPSVPEAQSVSRWPRRGRPTKRFSMPVLTFEQIRSIAPILHQELGTIRAVREELVQHNLRLVVWVAKTYRGRGLDLVDLIQEGNIGLLRAIDRFDPAMGTRFSTFATHWVRQGIGRALAEKARVIRIPLNRLPEVREAMQTQSRLTETLRRTPTLGEVAASMNIQLEKVHELLPALSPMDSIDAPLASGELTKADTLVDHNSASPIEQAMAAETARSVEKLLAHMPERERNILAMRYGIGYQRECTLEEIGHKLGLSRERIRQIEQSAREQLKSLCEMPRAHITKFDSTRPY